MWSKLDVLFPCKTLKLWPLNNFFKTQMRLCLFAQRHILKLLSFQRKLLSQATALRDGGKKKKKDTSTKFHLLFSFSKVISLYLLAVIWWLSLAGGEKAKHLSSHCCLPSRPCAPNVVGVLWVTSLAVTFCSFCLPSRFLFTVARHYDFLPNTL